MISINATQPSRASDASEVRLHRQHGKMETWKHESKQATASTIATAISISRSLTRPMDQ